MKVFDSTSFELKLPDEHRFPMMKYRLLARRVRTELPEADVDVAPRCARNQIEAVHDGSYVQRVFDGTLSASEIRRIGFPWSPSLVERSLRSAGATCAAAESALDEGVSVNLAGGTHHAHHGFGAGFCVFNDVCVAIALMKSRGLQRFATLDLDVHQGDGTAKLFENDPQVLTTSVHCEQNFPFRKAQSDLDINLQRHADDEAYLLAVDQALAVVTDHQPELVFYIAGADPFVGDQLGHLNVSKQGLLQRDAVVFNWARRSAIPLAVVMGGGYARNVDDIVSIHFNTVQLALASACEFNW